MEEAAAACSGTHPGMPAWLPTTLTRRRTHAPPPRPAPRDAYDAVYLLCNELSGDSTVIALSPADGTTSWALSTSALAARLTPVRAAAAAEGLFIYGDAGSIVTALDSATGALLWQVDVGRLPSTTITTSVTHLHLAADVLLVRCGALPACLPAGVEGCEGGLQGRAGSKGTFWAEPSSRLTCRC